MSWIWSYRKTRRPKVLRRLDELEPAKRVIVLKSRREIKRFLDELDSGGGDLPVAPDNGIGYNDT